MDNIGSCTTSDAWYFWMHGVAFTMFMAMVLLNISFFVRRRQKHL